MFYRLICFLIFLKRPHRFVEIEFYYTDAIHADPFTHKDPLQKTNGQWYFHKIGAQYKGGTYKGLDVTCGSPKVSFIGKNTLKIAYY
jgi:hypothetical protein